MTHAALDASAELAALYAVPDQVVLISGAGGGIGRALASAFARAGRARVALADLPGVRAHHELAEELGALGLSAIAVDGSVASESDVASMVEQTVERLGPVDILVNNAGAVLSKEIQDTTLDEWRSIFAVNVEGAFLLTRAVVEGMRRRRHGSIIQMSSVVAHQGSLAGDVPYTAAKSALVGFTKVLARTLGQDGIRVNAIAPGVVDTPMMRSVHDEAGVERIAQSIPTRSVVVPADIAAAALFLASPAAAQITGATLDVSGGMVMR